MGKAPSIIFIARHGARLDAENESWHLTSPTPYDTPLSYGGWTQTRALGARIASILHQRDLTLDEEDKGQRRRASVQDGIDTDTPTSPRPRKRRRKIVIHTSPFLRCIQSSIAISAGMAQYLGNLKKFEIVRSKYGPRPFRSQPSRSATLDPSVLEAKYAASEASSANRDKATGSQEQDDTPQPWKPTLRVDAFLGEWLSSNYFDAEHAPPPSKTMVAGAKANLVRVADPIHGARLADGQRVEEAKRPQSSPSSNIQAKPGSSIKFDLPDPRPSSSRSNGVMADGQGDAKDYAYDGRNGFTRTRHKSISEGYVPPTPTYAISTTETIPAGYVAHARDACIRLDYAWDSMERPQNWGDGGEYGEEWRSMHTRFRRGLAEMVKWYKMHGPYFDPQESSPDGPESPTRGDTEEGDEDLVVVLVTHGAGCNALIGALTNQPVLLDVGMASLTMAVHKTPSSMPTSPFARRMSVSSNRRRSSSIDLSYAEEYEMRLVASLDHLRAGADPLKIPQLQSPALGAIAESMQAGGDYLSSTSSDGESTPDSYPRGSQSTAIGSITRRTRALTSIGYGRTFSGASSRSSSGLWSGSGSGPSAAAPPIDVVGGLSDLSLSRQSSFDQNQADLVESPTTDGKMEEHVPPAPPTSVPAASNVVRQNSQRGLWGGGGTSAKPARRWTLMDQRR